MIGDQLRTDIAGANAYGIDSALISTGLVQLQNQNLPPLGNPPISSNLSHSTPNLTPTFPTALALIKQAFPHRLSTNRFFPYCRPFIFLLGLDRLLLIAHSTAQKKCAHTEKRTFSMQHDSFLEHLLWLLNASGPVTLRRIRCDKLFPKQRETIEVLLATPALQTLRDCCPPYTVRAPTPMPRP